MSRADSIHPQSALHLELVVGRQRNSEPNSLFLAIDVCGQEPGGVGWRVVVR